MAALSAHAQLLRTTPAFITETTNSITIFADATKGNRGILNATGDIFVHIGAITSLSTSSSNWRYVPVSWGVADNKVKCTKLANNVWSFTISGGLRNFFGMTNASETIQKIAILFRDAAGSQVLRNADASDMYIPVYENNLAVRIDSPLTQPTFTPVLEPLSKAVGDTISIAGAASNTAALSLFVNDSLIATTTGTSIAQKFVLQRVGTQKILLQGVSGSVTRRDSISFLVTGATSLVGLPAGVKDGINYEPGDTSVTLVLYAPKKSSITVTGDFNNWTPGLSHVMKMTPDSLRFWIRITGLTPGVEYAYQYIIDGALKVADYNATKVLDPWNDPFIAATTFPNLKPYPTGKTTEIVSVLQTAQPKYTWNDANFVRPNKKNLVVYELLLRDFVATHDFKTLKDTLPYLKKLGINAIELMPFSEFEGNSSWGYNPNFFFATDKYYGTPQAIKSFIDAAHQQGIAVIMDMVLNHAFGSSPLARMYWDGANNKPAANNPWLNPDARHPFNVGYDFNHESAATKEFVNRVTKYWLQEFHIDGYRWDLSKGFTQVNNPTNVGAWGNYDASRIKIWKAIYDTMQATSPGSYCMLEHFADNSEEKELADYGMLLWGNANHAFAEATMGYTSTSNFGIGFSNARNFAQQHLVTYMESHDEERLQYKNLNFGNGSGSYSARNPATGLKRNEMAAAIWALTPGPKLMWQFGELGYDFSINTCTNLTVDNNCRLAEKPIKWDYLQDANRKALFDAYAKFFKLRTTPAFVNDFGSNKYTLNTAGAIKSMQLNGDSIKLVVLGNFDVTPQTATVSFPTDGFWYSLYSNKYQLVSGGSASITLQPGEYFVYSNKNLNNAVVTSTPNISMPTLPTTISISPNPVRQAAILKYHLPESGKVSVKLLNQAGVVVEGLFNGWQNKGQQQLIINKKGLPTGVYHIFIQSNQKQKTQTFLITN
jgi:glycosidase